MHHTRRARTPHPRTASVAALAALLLLAACQGAQVGHNNPNAAIPWTEAELTAVLDLSELASTLQPSEDGTHLLLGGRPLPAEVLEANPHVSMGRSINLLRFDEELLEALNPEARAFIDLADANLLRDRLAEYGLSIAQVREAWGIEGEITLEQLLTMADALDNQPGVQTANIDGMTVGMGSLLLFDLGVIR